MQSDDEDGGGDGGGDADFGDTDAPDDSHESDDSVDNTEDRRSTLRPRPPTRLVSFAILVPPPWLCHSFCCVLLRNLLHAAHVD